MFLQITEDDIKKTYGGGPLRGYYSGVYSSSTNAYMLMYRQIDKNRNARAMAIEDFPPHIHKLLKDMQRKEEEDRRNREKANETLKINVYCIHPTTGMLQDARIAVFKDNTLEEAARDAYVRFKLESLVDISNCRLVLYNKKQECIDSSFDSNETRFCDNINLVYSEWMLEIREPGKSLSFMSSWIVFFYITESFIIRNKFIGISLYIRNVCKKYNISQKFLPSLCNF